MSVFAKGVLATIFVVGMLFGMVYLLMSMVLGPKLAYWVEGAVSFGVIAIMSFIWLISALGPVGPSTVWQTIAMGPNVTTATFKGTTYNVGDYPNQPPWVKPTVGKHLADLSGADDLASEASDLQTVMDSAIGNALSPVPGVKAKVASTIKGPIDLKTGTAGSYTEANVLMKQATVDGKDSIIAVGRGVPSEPVSAKSLPGQTGSSTTATVVKYLVGIGDTVTEGQNVVEITNNGQTAYLTSDKAGVVTAFGPAVGSLVRPGVPYLTLDVSGQAGQPAAINVVSVRVRGAEHTPAGIALVVSLILFVVHLMGVSRLEKSRNQAALAGQR